jgi:hypothetical protein
MAATGFTPIQLYRTSTASAIPTSGNLADGELAINLTDERLYFKNAAGTVKLLAANITPVANGGTGVTTSTGTGSVVLSDSPTLVTPALGTPSSGTLTNATGLPIVAGTTGTLSVDRGGTGATSLTANNVILGNGTSAVQVVAPSSSGNVLTSNGTTWQSTAPSVTTTNTATLTNKRITPRIVSITDAATITPTGDTADQYVVTALAQPATIATPSGTPTDGQKLTIRIEDNGVARALTWTTTSGAYRAVGAILPTTTNASKALYVGCIYNAQDVFWDVVAVAQQA